MADHRPRVRTDAAALDLHDWLEAAPALGRPEKDDIAEWQVTDDWPERVPVTSEEVDVFERWFGDVLDELFGQT